MANFDWTEWLNEARETWVEKKCPEKSAYDFEIQHITECCQKILGLSQTLSGSVLRKRLNYQWCLQHRNGLILIGLSQRHPLIDRVVKYNKSQSPSDGRSVKVEYADCIANKEISGKRKRGAVQSQPTLCVCTIQVPRVDDSTGFDVFELKGCVYGNIIEMNENLQKQLNNLISVCSIKDEWLLWLIMVMGHSKNQLQKSLMNHKEIPIQQNNSDP